MNDNDDDIIDQLNLDELYERRRELQEQKITIYKKILSRILKKIKTTSRLKHNEQFCFYVVPEIIIGFPRYNIKACIDYIIERLEENKLYVKYTDPNMLFISWQHYIPSFERNEIKKKTGVQVDGFGNVVEDKKDTIIEPIKHKPSSSTAPTRDFKKTSTYRPLGIYNEDMIRIINEKIN